MWEKRDEEPFGKEQPGLDDFLNSQPTQIAKGAKIQRLTTNETYYGENIKGWWDRHLLLLKRLVMWLVDPLHPPSRTQKWRWDDTERSGNDFCLMTWIPVTDTEIDKVCGNVIPGEMLDWKEQRKREKVADFQTFIRRKWTKLATLLQTCAVLQKKERIIRRGGLQAQRLEPPTAEVYAHALKPTEFSLRGFQIAWDQWPFTSLNFVCVWSGNV